MALSTTDLIFLQSPTGSNLLAELAQEDLSPSAILPLVTRLRQTYSPEQIQPALTMAQLRQSAVPKFGADARVLFFTDDALQQASDPAIRAYRAQGSAGLRVLDVCCGIGTDSIAFARAGAIVQGLDNDPIRIAIARHNATQLRLPIQFDVADVTHGIATADYDLIFYDPARRDADGNRLYDVEHYIPPLSLMHGWHAPRIMTKISPGVDLAQLSAYQASVEFISVGGDLKEAVLQQPLTIPLRATRIDADGIAHHWDNDGDASPVALAEPQGWLCEPDPAILRANLVQQVTTHYDGTMLDETIAYFCTTHAPSSEWVRAWRIREWLPFNLKHLRARLRAQDVGTLTVKKRGSPIQPQDLIRRLKLKGSTSATVVLTRYRENPIAIICDDILAL
ncbi:MAG: class I SAM-dependent methyltransferase [Anaerolineae bacterium]